MSYRWVVSSILVLSLSGCLEERQTVTLEPDGFVVRREGAGGYSAPCRRQMTQPSPTAVHVGAVGSPARGVSVTRAWTR